MQGYIPPTARYVLLSMKATFEAIVATRGEYKSITTAPMPEGYKKALAAQKKPKE